MITVKILEEHGLSLHTSSPQTAAKQLEDCLNGLANELGASPMTIATRSIGRSTYHLAVFLVESTDNAKPAAEFEPDVDPQSEASVAAEKKRVKRSSSKAA